MQPMLEEICRHAYVYQRDYTGHQENHDSAHQQGENQVKFMFWQFLHIPCLLSLSLKWQSL